MAYFQPTALPEALGLLEQSDACIVAGGTDVYPAMTAGMPRKSFLDVTRIEGLSEITKTENNIRIGAAATWSDIVAADLPSAFDALKAAAREVGSLQIQNAGTVAGNICNASPAADGVPPLLALNAEVEVMSAARGTRVLPLGRFIQHVRKTVLKPDELVTAILVPHQPDGMMSAFEKLGSRRYLVISIAMTAVNILQDTAGRITSARVAVGACSAVAQRLTRLEADLIGTHPSTVTITPDHLAPLSPIDDVRGSGAYRHDAARHQICRAIAKATRT